jgi:adenylate cyclase
VFKFDGIVDKYIGDALMASFGTIEDVPDAEYRAVAAGIAFQDAVSSWNVDRKRNGKLPISVGVGINTGDLLLTKAYYLPALLDLHKDLSTLVLEIL